MKIEILMSSLKKKHEASLIAFISIGMMATGFALTAVAPPLLYIFESGDFSVRLSFFKGSLEGHINTAIMGIFLLVAGLTVFIQGVDDGFMEGLSKLTDSIPDEVVARRLNDSSRDRLFHNITGFLIHRVIHNHWGFVNHGLKHWFLNTSRGILQGFRFSIAVDCQPYSADCGFNPVVIPDALLRAS
jgi:hypothetical protein